MVAQIVNTYETDGKYYVRERLEELAQEYGFYYTLTFSNKLKRCMARVEHYSTPLVTFNLNYVKQCVEHGALDELEDTILHETAHILVGGSHKHDYVWRKKCLELGGNGEQYNKAKFYKRLVKTYIYECPHCHKQFKEHGKLRKNYSCTTCCKEHNGNSKYDERFKIELVKVLEEYK